MIFLILEIIQEELAEINRLQEEIYGTLLSFSDMEKDERMENVEKLQTLLNNINHVYEIITI